MTEKHHRRSIRLKEYDYARAGAYFVTICAQDREHRFGEVVNDEMRLDVAGEMAQEMWLALPNRFPNVELDAFVVMPNHVHGIILIVHDADVRATPDVGATLVVAHDAEADTSHRAGTRPAPTLGGIVGAYKSITTHEYVMGVRHHGWPRFEGKLWQRNYYEHIVRNERELNAIRRYIEDNPMRWQLDRDNPNNAQHWPAPNSIEIYLNEITTH